jgi:AraC-like DNA-binding protein
MRRSARDERCFQIYHLSCTSHAARRILQDRARIESQLAATTRKVWPVARVARFFEVSERLVWNWIASGVLRRYRPPSRSHRKGVTSTAIQAFLRDLEQYASFGIELTRERRRPAWERGIAEARKLREDEELTPAQFAARAGISVATVHRLLADKVLHSERPTAHRIKICHRWREKYRKKRLTGKKSKKSH